MRRIDLTPYKVNAPANGKLEEKLSQLLALPEETPKAKTDLPASPANEPTAIAKAEADYDVRGSIVEILFHPDLQLGAKALLDRDTLARKVNDWPDNDLLLEETDYKKVLAALEVLKGLTRQDVEFVSRVLNAPEVAVEVKVKVKEAA